MIKYLKNFNVRFLSTCLAVGFAIPWGLKELTGFYNWLSPFIMLCSVFMLGSLVWLNVPGLVVLVLAFLKKRWFCRKLCPVGFGCDYFSKIGFRNNFSLRNIPDLGRWIALISLGGAFAGIPFFIILDPMAFFNGFFSIFSGPVTLTAILLFLILPVIFSIHLIFPNIWCGRICPLGGLQDELYRLSVYFGMKNKNRVDKDDMNSKNRRLFIASGAGLLAGLIIPRWINFSSCKFIRPPASLRYEDFNLLCVRCGSCIKTCPSNIIVHHKSMDDVTAWMTPEVSFENNGYCLEDCNLCGTVCPSGAISPFEVKAKRGLFMAGIQIDVNKCLLKDQIECSRCKSVCSYEAITIISGHLALSQEPVVNPDKCVGCGACAAVCPPAVIMMVPVINE